MDIQRMHTTFRTLGQQAGMQLVRGILPESIDVYLNEAIIEKVRSVVMVNTMMQFNDRVAIQNASIAPINSIRTLVKRGSLTIGSIATGDDFYKVDVSTIQSIMFYTSFGIKYTGNNTRIGARFIDNDKIDTTRSDYCNRDTWDEPIVTMFTDDTNKEYIEAYIGNTNKIPNKLDIIYIKLPKIVKWDSVSGNRIDCNLPEYVHNEIVNIAVDKFFRSIGYTTKQTK